MSENSPNEVPKLTIRSREVSEEDKRHTRSFEEQSAFEHTQAPEESELKTLAEKPSSAEDTMKIPHHDRLEQAKLDPAATTLIAHEEKENFMNVTALEPNAKLASDISPDTTKKSPLKLARPSIQPEKSSHIPSTFANSDTLPKLDELELPKKKNQTHNDFQEKLFEKLEIKDGKMPSHIKITTLALGGVLLTVAILMGTYSFMASAVIAFLFNLAIAKLANQQFFIQGIGALLGRAVYTGIFIIFAVFLACQISNFHSGLSSFSETQTESLLHKLEKPDEIKSSAKSFFVILKGNEDLLAAKALEFTQKSQDFAKKIASLTSSIGMQLVLLTAGFFLIGLGLCKFCFPAAPLALSSRSNTFAVIMISRTCKSIIVYFLALISFKITQFPAGTFLATSLFLVSLISPFSILFLFISSLYIFICTDLSQAQTISLALISIIFFVMELNFKLIIKPFSALKNFIPTEFFSDEIQDTQEALLALLQTATQIIIVVACLALSYLSYSVYDMKKAIDENEAIYLSSEKDFAINGPKAEIKKAIDKGLIQKEDDRRWLMLKLKYFIAKKQYSTAIDIAKAFEKGHDYPALNPKHYLVRFVKSKFSQKFNDGQSNTPDAGYALLLSTLDFAQNKAYIAFAEQYLAENPDSLIAYLATARYYVATRKAERAKSNLESILPEMKRIAPESIETKLLTSYHLYLSKKYDDAEKAFNHIILQDSIYLNEAKMWAKRSKEKSRNSFFGDE